MSKDPIWMPLYIADYMLDTAHLSTEEHGAYLLLLLHAWMNKGALPNDDERLRRITRMEKRAWNISKNEIKSFFYEHQGVLRHRRIDLELQRAQEMVNQRSMAGKASAAKRGAERNHERNGSGSGNETRNENGNDSSNEHGNENSTSVATNVERPKQRKSNQSQSQLQVKTIDVTERVVNTTVCSVENERTAADASRTLSPKPPDRFFQTQLPPDFLPDEAAIRLAQQHALEIGIERERFVAHYTATGELRANWQAQFRKWLLGAMQRKSDIERRSQSPPSRGGGKQELMMAAGRSLFAHKDTETGHEREIEGTAEFVECDTDQPIAGIVDQQDL